MTSNKPKYYSNKPKYYSNKQEILQQTISQNITIKYFRYYSKQGQQIYNNRTANITASKATSQ